MANIQLTDEESALWKEAGSRGDEFRRAIRDRAAEQARQTGWLSEIRDEEGKMVANVDPAGPDPESQPK